MMIRITGKGEYRHWGGGGVENPRDRPTYKSPLNEGHIQGETDYRDQIANKNIFHCSQHTSLRFEEELEEK